MPYARHEALRVRFYRIQDARMVARGGSVFFRVPVALCEAVFVCRAVTSTMSNRLLPRYNPARVASPRETRMVYGDGTNDVIGGRPVSQARCCAQNAERRNTRRVPP